MQATNQVLCSLSFQNEIRHIFCSSRPSLPFRRRTFSLSQAATAFPAAVNFRRVLSTACIIILSARSRLRWGLSRWLVPWTVSPPGLSQPGPCLQSSLSVWEVQRWPRTLRLAASPFSWMRSIFFPSVILCYNATPICHFGPPRLSWWQINCRCFEGPPAASGGIDVNVWSTCKFYHFVKSDVTYVAKCAIVLCVLRSNRPE